MREPSERAVRGVFLAVLVVFPIQYLFAKERSEPYPALLMPGFAGARLDAQGRLTTETADVVFRFRDGRAETVSLRKLFERAPVSHFEAMARTALKPKPDAPTDEVWGRSRVARFLLAHVIPGKPLGDLRGGYWAGVSPDVARWLGRRGAELFPGERAVEAEVVWHVDLYAWRDGRLERSRTPGETVRVPL